MVSSIPSHCFGFDAGKGQIIIVLAFIIIYYAIQFYFYTYHACRDKSIE